MSAPNFIELPTAAGQLRGRVTHAANHRVLFFGNIPYAQSPFGVNRFKPPQPAPPWSGVRDATMFGAAAPQAPRIADEAETIVGGDDCLTLNIWTTGTDAPKPVFIYLPGGGFMRGQSADPIYDGAAFARQGIVFVSFNYRIGIDGFMLLDDPADGEVSANRGLLDQIAAIEWVTANIAAFGGDASQITLGGVSAGAGAIVHLLGAPQLAGKISRAILQSPSITAQTRDEAQQSRAAIAALLACPPTGAALRAQPLHRVVRAVARLLADYDLRRRYNMSPKHFFPLRPVVDGALVHADPLARLRAQWSQPGAHTPSLLVGANADEMNFYLVPTGEIDRVDWARVETFARAVGLDASAWKPDGHAGEQLAKLQGAHYYQKPAQALASLISTFGADAWHYNFEWKSPHADGRMGAAHATELPFVFNCLATARGREVAGENPPQRLADEMHGAWAAFARGEAPADWCTNETKTFS